MGDAVERVETGNKGRSLVVAVLVTIGILICIPVAGYGWIVFEGLKVADRTTAFLEAWQARDYRVVQELLDENCFQTAEDLRATLGDSEITNIDVDRRPYSFGTVTRGSISFDNTDVQNFEFNFEGDKLCGPTLWDPQD
jgi:hypothetical protein